MYSKRTDLALETRESFPGDGGEIEGVKLNKESITINSVQSIELNITTVEITNNKGSELMNKPIGTYITIDTGDVTNYEQEDRNKIIDVISKNIEQLAGNLSSQNLMVAGLGNRQVTADSLGPLIVDNLNISRHLAREYGDSFLESLGLGKVCAIAPGVMAQTGMEAEEVLHAITDDVKPDIIIVLDALAARSADRVTTTIQITDTGINPGSGVGNHRIGIDSDSLGTKVIAIGVPTVVEAEVIVGDRIERFMQEQGFSDDEIQKFLCNMGEPAIKDMYVTPKNIDETVDAISILIADVINNMTSRN